MRRSTTQVQPHKERAKQQSMTTHRCTKAAHPTRRTSGRTGREPECRRLLERLARRAFSPCAPLCRVFVCRVASCTLLWRRVRLCWEPEDLLRLLLRLPLLLLPLLLTQRGTQTNSRGHSRSDAHVYVGGLGAGNSNRFTTEPSLVKHAIDTPSAHKDLFRTRATERRLWAPHVSQQDATAENPHKLSLKATWSLRGQSRKQRRPVARAQQNTES